MIVSVNKIASRVDKYDTIDTSLIASKDFTRQFGTAEDYIEYHVYTIDNSLLYSNYNYTGYRVPDLKIQGGENTYTQELELFPGETVESLGYTYGSYIVQYNIFRKKVVNVSEKIFFIKEISSDRKELRVSSNSLSSLTIEEGVLNFLYEIETASYFKDFLLNFGDNKIVNAVNIALDKNTDPYSILIKLYQPLPDEFTTKDSFWVVEELSEAAVYEVELAPTPIQTVTPFLKGANFDIEVDENSVKPSNYLNINELLSNQSLGAYQELISTLNNKGIQVNVNYADYSDFVHFSSAKERLLNFRYKVEVIEAYQSDIAAIQATVNYTGSFNSSASIASLQAKIDSTIKNFDGYESYLYYTSESAAWPKSTSVKPYTLYASNSTEVTNWLGSDDYNSPLYGGQLSTASLYDLENQDNLAYIVPEYISVDPVNDGYTLFLNMVGQHFDNIWIYIKSIGDFWKNTNSVYTGISKDLVYYALRSLGIKLYNSKSNDNIFQYLIGSSASGSFLPTGSSFDTIVSASAYSIAGQDIQKETLKRIYHNLPYLLKAKGTARGVKALITAYGIPDTILSPVEFGGVDKYNDSVEYVYDRFSYALNMSASYVQTAWAPVPDSVEFRFKPDKDYYSVTSSLVDIAPGIGSKSLYVTMYPDIASGYPYSLVNLYLSGSGGYVNTAVSLPIYKTGSSGDTEWWNVMLTRRVSQDINQTTGSQYYDLYVKNKIGTRIGHQASASLFVDGSVSSSYNFSWAYPSQSLYLGGTGSAFVGNVQELRYWSAPLSESAFNSHVLSPESYRGNYSGSAYDYLTARFPLGNNLYVYNHSVTSSVYSVQPNITYSKSASFFGFSNTINYTPNEEEYVADSMNMVYSIPVDQKVRIQENTITGSVLSPFLRLEDDTQVYRTKDTHFVDVSFSPANEINRDIINQFGGSVNIDNLIGDPRDNDKSSYPDLTELNAEYYEKYFRRYNLADFVRLIKFFDNSLFKMIKDYVPVRSNVQTGLTIKSPMLERPKAKITKAGLTENYQSVEGGIEAGEIEASSIYISGYGDGRDFFLGELSGSVVNIHQDFQTRNRNPYL